MNEVAAIDAAITMPRRFTGLIASLGGTIGPVLYVLRENRPTHVALLCSPPARKQAELVRSQIDWPMEQFDTFKITDFEELSSCYRQIRGVISRIIRDWPIPTEDIVVDYTGGTKTVSAALVLAAVEMLSHFSYVGGEQRDKAGLGATIPGNEHLVYVSNPWAEMAVRDLEAAKHFWDNCIFEETARVLAEAAQRVPQSKLFGRLAVVAQALAERHRLNFNKALKLIGPVKEVLETIFENRHDFGLLDLVRSTISICSQCQKGKANDVLLSEIVDNSLRTAMQGRYEDAAARLYRAFEMQGQLWLEEASNGVFVDGRASVQPASLLGRLMDGAPASFRELIHGVALSDGQVKLSLEQLFLAAASLGHAQALYIADDIKSGPQASHFRKATFQRNQSILAHGTTPIGTDGYEEMKKVAKEFFARDMTRESCPIPPFNLAWADVVR